MVVRTKLLFSKKVKLSHVFFFHLEGSFLSNCCIRSLLNIHQYLISHQVHYYGPICFRKLKRILKSTFGPMIFYNKKWFGAGIFSLAVSSIFFLQGEQTTKIYNVHQSDLNNEIKRNLPNKICSGMLLILSFLTLNYIPNLNNQLTNTRVNKLKRNTTY